ncbi:MAG: YidC/Oxa1 family membrane protein insertase [bacterium]
MLTELFNLILYQPLFQALLWFYHYIPDFGIVIIILTIIIRIILYPLNQKTLKSQEELAALQPKIKDLQSKYAGNKVKQGEIMMNLYKEHKINPFSSFLPMLIQLPILIALFKVFIDLSKNSELINPMFLNLIDLSQRSILLSVLAGITQFWQSKSMPGISQQNSKFIYFMPLITVFIGLSLPAGLPLYWITITILTILQQYIYAKTNQRHQKAN